MTTPVAPTLSAAETTAAARIGKVLFENRGWLPVFFLAIPLLAPGHQTAMSWIVGLVIVGIGEFIRASGVAAAGSVTRRRSREVQRLVTYGAFAFCRNPLYVGNFIIWMGFAVVSGVYWFIPVAIVVFAIEYTLIVRYEEGVLESIFGAEYLEYKAKVPRWFGLTPSVPSAGPHNWPEAIRSERSTFMQYVAISAAFWYKGKRFG